MLLAVPPLHRPAHHEGRSSVDQQPALSGKNYSTSGFRPYALLTCAVRTRLFESTGLQNGALHAPYPRAPPVAASLILLPDHRAAGIKNSIRLCIFPQWLDSERCSPGILVLKFLMNSFQGSKDSGWCFACYRVDSRRKHYSVFSIAGCVLPLWYLSFWRFHKYFPGIDQWRENTSKIARWQQEYIYSLYSFSRFLS